MEANLSAAGEDGKTGHWAHSLSVFFFIFFLSFFFPSPLILPLQGALLSLCDDNKTLHILSSSAFPPLRLLSPFHVFTTPLQLARL